MTNEKITDAQVVEAIEFLDDLARMSVGVDPKGPRELLHRYVAQVKQAAALDLRDDVIATLEGQLAQERALCDERGRRLDERDEELERLRAQVTAWESELSAIMPADFKDWHQNSRSEWPAVAAAVIRSLRAGRDRGWDVAARAQVAPAGWRETLQSIAYSSTDAVARGFAKAALAASPAATAQQAGRENGENAAKSLSQQGEVAGANSVNEAQQAAPSLTVGDESVAFQYLRESVAKQMAALAPAAQAEPVAWMDPQSRDVIHADRKTEWQTSFGQGGQIKAATYTMPLYAAPPSQPAAQRVGELPPLPKHLMIVDAGDDDTFGALTDHAWNSDYSRELKVDAPMFTAGQMRDYARAAIAQAPSAQGVGLIETEEREAFVRWSFMKGDSPLSHPQQRFIAGDNNALHEERQAEWGAWEARAALAQSQKEQQP